MADAKAKKKKDTKEALAKKVTNNYGADEIEVLEGPLVRLKSALNRANIEANFMVLLLFYA